MSNDVRICTTCNGLGQERRHITNPQANVYGWTRERTETPGFLSDWWRRRCEPCQGSGFTPVMKASVPAVSPPEAKP